MFLQRSAAVVARTATRSVARRAFTTSVIRRDASKQTATDSSTAANMARSMKKLEDIKTEEDLLPPGAKVGTIPTDIEQSTGLERLEILGKMQGIDIFDMKPLDASRVGTPEDPIIVNSFGPEQHVGCTGCPADSHHVLWITMTREEPMERCIECGSVYKMHYVGPEDDGHHHVENNYPRPKNMADFIKPEYKWA
ncbi:cytochrome c oxidase subunit VB [Delitschia confertaspora ATCC 74209]|uniref:Cytochrome c oxidase subunit 4, mitochondrial n=1 Tax=Delitschia confertaspora ATCC 74209 TaxID=1513339 RepID=A0A9P4MWV2_9PLEO|nr:cytochrome c oxidase subunit VB [Delitschia confertaspora ATCC 74209]